MYKIPSTHGLPLIIPLPILCSPFLWTFVTVSGVHVFSHWIRLFLHSAPIPCPFCFIAGECWLSKALSLGLNTLVIPDVIVLPTLYYCNASVALSLVPPIRHGPLHFFALHCWLSKVPSVLTQYWLSHFFLAHQPKIFLSLWCYVQYWLPKADLN